MSVKKQLRVTEDEKQLIQLVRAIGVQPRLVISVVADYAKMPKKVQIGMESLEAKNGKG
ncbi:MAG: hypothetical protein ACYDDH_12000 [Candidatus Desulforudaceae bacterium]